MPTYASVMAQSPPQQTYMLSGQDDQGVKIVGTRTGCNQYRWGRTGSRYEWSRPRGGTTRKQTEYNVCK